MGLLIALDAHGEKQAGVEIEYRLHSWGEIFPPFFGDREHSIESRFILKQFPFKLFSSSVPYDDPLPQKLCLTFIVPNEVKVDKQHIHISGFFPHEIAKEFAAFLSTYTRRRVFADRLMRYGGLPLEEGGEIYQRANPQERQRLKEIDPAEVYELLNKLSILDRNIANGLIIAMRLYHSAIGMMFSDPEFAYLFFIMALETVSSIVEEGYEPPDKTAFLDARFAGWRANLSEAQKAPLMKILIGNEKFISRKISKFVRENVPERFWSETEDDAKPDYPSVIYGKSADGITEERVAHSDITLWESEKISRDSLEAVLGAIYSARSKMVHEGIPLPKSIVIGHFRDIPVDIFSQIMPEGDITKRLAIPPLLTFERLTSYLIIEFLRKSGHVH